MRGLPPAAVWSLLALAFGLAGAGLVLSGAARGSAPPVAPVAAPPTAAEQAVLAQRMAQLEESFASFEPAAARILAEMRASALNEALAAPRSDRFVAAALTLQATVATPRPFTRELQVLRENAPPQALPAPLAEVLASHAGRGLPTVWELRETFEALSPDLLARAPVEGWRLLGWSRGALASIGLTRPPPVSAPRQAVTEILQSLGRGHLAAAVADATTLDASVQPMLTGWMAQARARLSVEQAINETLLRALARPGRTG